MNILSEYTERMVRLVNLLLDVSRIEAGRFVLQRVPLSLEQLTAESINLLKPYAGESRISITFEAKSHDKVLGDTDRLRMVIQNLIDNAIRYSSDGGEIKIVIANKNGSVEWRISDRGIGIPNNQQKYIFQKFFRAANASRYQSYGTGLGLYIAHRIINDLGGKMGFESSEGQGSTFWFRLPIYG
jgi:signal transduction histidine kinase